MPSIKCDLDCCFRWYQHPENPEFISILWLGDPDEDRSEYSICTATKEEWETEIREPIEDEIDGSYMGGVPLDCPIYQGLIDAPWISEQIGDSEKSE